MRLRVRMLLLLAPPVAVGACLTQSLNEGVYSEGVGDTGISTLDASLDVQGETRGPTGVDATLAPDVGADAAGEIRDATAERDTSAWKDVAAPLPDTGSGPTLQLKCATDKDCLSSSCCAMVDRSLGKRTCQIDKVTSTCNDLVCLSVATDGACPNMSGILCATTRDCANLPRSVCCTLAQDKAKISLCLDKEEALAAGGSCDL